MTRLLWSAAIVALGAAPAIAQPGPEPQAVPAPEARHRDAATVDAVVLGVRYLLDVL